MNGDRTAGFSVGLGAVSFPVGGSDEVDESQL